VMMMAAWYVMMKKTVVVTKMTVMAGNGPTTVAFTTIFFCHLFCSTHVFTVASVAFAAGTEEIGVYIPIFASAGSWFDVMVLICLLYTCFVGWSYLAYSLVEYTAIAKNVKEYGEFVGPTILIGLGLYVLFTCQTIPFIANQL